MKALCTGMNGVENRSRNLNGRIREKRSDVKEKNMAETAGENFGGRSGKVTLKQLEEIKGVKGMDEVLDAYKGAKVLGPNARARRLNGMVTQTRSDKLLENMGGIFKRFFTRSYETLGDAREATGKTGIEAVGATLRAAYRAGARTLGDVSKLVERGVIH